jgi:hypothetical protein
VRDGGRLARRDAGADGNDRCWSRAVTVSEQEKPRGRWRRFVFDPRADLLLAHLAERTEESEGIVIGRALNAYRWLLRERDNGGRFAVERSVEVELHLPFIGHVGSVRRRRLYEVRLDAWLTARKEHAAP